MDDDTADLQEELAQLEHLVAEFSDEMRMKLCAKAKAGARGWDECGEYELIPLLREHLERAEFDPKQWIDVANFAAFLWKRTR